jgi:hypothetical protein
MSCKAALTHCRVWLHSKPCPDTDVRAVTPPAPIATGWQYNVIPSLRPIDTSPLDHAMLEPRRNYAGHEVQRGMIEVAMYSCDCE